ncbi:MAG: SDR family oxidoreductase [Dysgonamonadaceae bacterium]
MNKIALITGASSGIGEATAYRLAKENYDLIVTARRAEKIGELKNYLEDKYGIRVLPLCFDVRNQEEVSAHLGNLPGDWKNIDLLVNNAGLASGLTPLQDGDIEDWEKMIDTNIKGLLYVTRAIAPGMKERRKGHIVNLSSIAGKEAYPNGNVYCGTKHAVEAIGKGMRMDLLPYGVKVTQICPGAVETEFSIVRFHGDKERADKVYQGFQPLRPEDIADAICYVVSLPAHVCINDMLIMPTAQANATLFHREE